MADWFVNLFGVWYASGDWSAGGATACPPLGINDEHVQIVAYDEDLGTSLNDVSYAVIVLS